MIHQVNRLPIANRLLPDMMALQVVVLEAVAQANVTKAIVLEQTAFSPILENHLMNKRRFRGREVQVARWITAKTKALIKPLSDFADAQSQEKSQFVSGIRNDITLLYRPRTASFNIAVLQGDPAWKIGAKNFLYAFYDLLSDGFSSILFSTACNGSKYTRQDFVHEFQEKNPNLFICAVCDGAAYSTRTEAQIHTSVEHFFPRSIYPHLSCHPLNLIPICSNCNSYIKGDTNPLILNGQLVGLMDFILPYQKQGFAFREQAYIAVVKRDPRLVRYQHPLRLELRPARDFQAGNKINTFNNLYKVDERWSESLHEIEDQVFRRVTQFLSLVDPANLTSDPTVLSRYFKLLMAQTDLENLGKDPYAFPMVWLLKSYLDQIEMQKENAPIYKAFRNWVTDNRERLSRLEERSLRIHARVPIEGT